MVSGPTRWALAALLVPVAVGAQSGRVVEDTVGSDLLGNLLREPEARTVHVYLPPGYDAAVGRRYPVVVLLHAFGAHSGDWLGTDRGYEGLDVAQALDSLINSGEVGELIVAMPDAHTALGGSWYTSSPATGDWERFIVEDLVAHVDRRYRTRARPEHRGIAGQSMGAYGALRIALRHPGAFGAVVALSPVPVQDPNPLGDAGMRAALEADRTSLGSSSILARVLWSRAAAFSPAPDEPPAFARLPYRIEGDSLVQVAEVWDAWKDATLQELAKQHPDALDGVAVRLEVGSEDPLNGEVSALSRTLRDLGVVHDFVTFPGGHVAGVRARFEGSVFRFLSEVLGEPPPA